IHCREAFDEVFEVLEQEKSDELFGIFHCFTGDLHQAQHAIDLNLHLGIGGVATFKNGKIDQFLNQIPLNHIVLETDAPYLAPVPHRGKRNESSYVALVAQKLAAIYNLPVTEIAAQTTKNALNILNCKLEVSLFQLRRYQTMSKFDSIRFYHDEEVPGILQNIAHHPMVKSLIEYTFPEYSDEQVAQLVNSIQSIRDFQSKIIYHTLQRVLENSSEGLTSSGFDKL